MRSTQRYSERTLKFSILIPLLALFLTACGEEASDAKHGNRLEKATPVVAFSAEYEDLKDSLRAVGTARSLLSVTLYPESSGIVRQVNFQPDELVKEGAVLLELDSRDEVLAVELANVQLQDAERSLKRYTALNAANKNIPESTVDEARLALESAKVALNAAELALERRKVRAPFDSHVGLTDIDVGDRVETSTSITTLDDRSELLVHFAVPESYIAQVAPGTVIEARLWDSRQPPLIGEVVATDSRVDPTSRAFTARASLDNSNDLLRPGMAFEIAVNVSKGRYLAVPDVAVQWGADGAYLWRVIDGQAKRAAVNLVQRLEGKLLVEGEISEGDLIVAEGVQSVRQGSALRLLDADLLDQDARKILATPATGEEPNNNG